MSHACPSCNKLLSSGRIQPPHHLISRITNSELFKCDDCQAYLLRENGDWEMLEPTGTTHPGEQRKENRLLVQLS